MAEQRTIYTVGYNARGWTPDTLLDVQHELSAGLLDIRISPHSRKSEWNREAMQDRHCCYKHMPEFGNLNYKGGPIKLANTTKGIQAIRRIFDPQRLDQQAVILLCACPDHRRCHRTTVAELCQREIREYDIRIEHLYPPAAAPKIGPDGLPAMALSIMQPWAWAIVEADKDVENRTWATNYRGPICIHAGKKYDSDGADSMMFHDYLTIPPDLPKGGIVGVAEIVDCVTRHRSRWFIGPYGFVLRNARPVPFVPCRGRLGFFRWREGSGNV